MGKTLHILWGLLLTVLLAACSSRPFDVREVVSQPDIYPDYVGVTIPVGIAPLNFAIVDTEVSVVDVEVNGTQGGKVTAHGDCAEFDLDEWHALLEQNKGARLVVSVCAKKGDEWIKYRDFTIFVSSEPLEEWGITYRRIPPSYKIYSHMGLYQRDLSSFAEQAMLENTQSPGMCINCHTANRTNPDQYVFHERVGKNCSKP